MNKWRTGAAAALVGVIVSWSGGAGPAHAADVPVTGEQQAQAVDDSGNGPVRPMLECVAVNGDGSYTAVFGTYNPSTKARTEPVGAGNLFQPGDPDRGQPTTFAPDRTVASFSTTFSSPELTWVLNGRGVTASASSQPCNSAPNVSEATMPILLAAALMILSGGWLWRRRRTV
jgi:MYXO-CTERM domain-containing protein